MGLVRKWICALMMTAAVSAAAQQITGSIRGTVTDESRAVVADALVTATNSSIGVSFAVRTTAAGTYNIAALPSGVYTVEVGQAGFKTVQFPNSSSWKMTSLMVSTTVRYLNSLSPRASSERFLSMQRAIP